MSGDIPRQATVDQEPQATVDEELAALPFPDQQISFLTRTLRHEVATDRTDWIFTLAALVSRHQLSRHVARRSAADLAWAAREAGQRYPNDADWSRCSEAADSTISRRGPASGWDSCRMTLSSSPLPPSPPSVNGPTEPST